VQQTILIVDDDAGIREALFYILRHDFRVLLVEDGGDAVETAETHRVDLAFVDVFLPTLNGFDVLERLAKLTVPVIMMSVITEPEIVVQAMKSGAVHFITKDFVPEAVLSLVQSYLG
jgi:DNA-binding response OmpR family regulator